MNLVTSQANPIWNFRRNTGGPRRIVHVPPRFASAEWTGAEASLLELAKQQLGAGMEPIVITTLALSEIRHEVVDGVRVDRHPHSYFLFGEASLGATGQSAKDPNLLAIPVFQSLMQEPDVRLFHTHTLGRLGGEVLQAARMRFRPFVATVHQEANISSLSTVRKELEGADMVIFTDKYEAEHAPEQLGHDRVAHLPHGVDCGRFTVGNGASFREQHAIPPDAFVAGGLSRSTPQKISLLVEAFSTAAARQRGMHLVLTTTDMHADDAIRLRARIQELGLSDQVHLLSECRRDDRANVFAACDAIVMLPWRQASPSELLEFWSAGKPVIGDRFSGIGNLVREGDTGLLFDPESATAVEKLAAHLEVLVSDTALRSRMGELGRTEAQAHDWSHVGRQLEEIYKLAEKHHQIARQQGRKAA
jgi:glycosyltransferase involved in cell wall biosynthesis